ncbi:MAG TPA: hypothetical protein VFZ23_14755 [Pyrinomonadaceae bacterium]
MCLQLRIRNLLIALACFGLGVVAADVFSATEQKPDPLSNYILNVRQCLPRDEVGRPGYGPGSEVYRKRKERVRKIERELTDLENKSRHSARGEHWCATAYLRAVSNLIEERELMLDLIETADGTKLVYREVCYEN